MAVAAAVAVALLLWLASRFGRAWAGHTYTSIHPFLLCLARTPNNQVVPDPSSIFLSDRDLAPNVSSAVAGARGR